VTHGGARRRRQYFRHARTVAIASASGDSCLADFHEEGAVLPSLIRFLVIVAVLAALAYAGMLAIVAYVTPQPREMTQTIAPQRLNK
jgi:hypothetical protein